MSTLRKETMYKSSTKRIGLSVWKDDRKNLVMHLQEFDLDPAYPGVETILVFKSWSVTVCRTPCARATDAAVTRFYDANIERARKLVAARVAVLEAEVPA
jgi:hypothetical protein